jgi:hypothetical protein
MSHLSVPHQPPIDGHGGFDRNIRSIPGLEVQQSDRERLSDDASAERAVVFWKMQSSSETDTGAPRATHDTPPRDPHAGAFCVLRVDPPTPNL